VAQMRWRGEGRCCAKGARVESKLEFNPLFKPLMEYVDREGRESDLETAVTELARLDAGFGDVGSRHLRSEVISA
jgi:hypothetical protein